MLTNEEIKAKMPRTHTALNYGTLPSRDEFDTAFYAVTSDHVGYRITHGSPSRPYEERPDAGIFSCGEMWRELNRLIKHNDETALQWASDILDTLGFEWV